MNHMINGKEKKNAPGLTFLERIFFPAKKRNSLISAIFPIMATYNLNKINVGNPQIKLL